VGCGMRLCSESPGTARTGLPAIQDERLGAEFVGPAPGPDARCREKIPTADMEELRILTTRCIEPLMLGESPIVSAENQQRRVAVAAVACPVSGRGMSIASCGTATNSAPSMWNGSTARAPDVCNRPIA